MRHRVGILPCLLGALVVSLLAVTACTGQRASLAPDASSAGAARNAKIATLDPRAADLTLVATAAVATVEVFDAPDAATGAIHTLTHPRPAGTPLVFVVERATEGWYQMLLPMGPAGAAGWVRASDVVITQHNVRLEVQLGARTLVMHQNGLVARELPIELDPQNVPQVGGRYFTTELLPASATDTFGAFAYGVSGWGDEPTTFAAAPGQLGIHGGADAADSADGTGSVALTEDDIRLLVAIVPPAGVRVTVTA